MIDSQGAAGFAAALRTAATGDADSVELIDLIRWLEELKSAAAAAQARATAQLAAIQRAAQQAAGVSARDITSGWLSEPPRVQWRASSPGSGCCREVL